MPAHAGFAAAITIRERLLNDSLLLAYHAGNISHRIAGPIPDGPPNVAVNFFVEAPHVECHGDDPQHFTVQLRGWGPLAILFNGATQQRSIRFEMQLLIRPRFALVGSDLTLALEGNDITLPVWDFEVLSGGPYTPDADLYLRGGVFRQRMLSAVRLAISLGLLDVPPIDVSFLGSIAQAASMDTVSRVVDDAIVVGLNVVSDGIVTAGNPALLADFARNNDIAVVTNPVAVPVMFRDAEAQIRDEVAKHNATLERLSITAEEGRFRVRGKASRSGGSVTFSFAVVPLMFHGRQGAFIPYPKKTVVVKGRSWPALGFEATEISVDTDLDAWVIALTALSVVITGAVLPLFVADLVRGIEQQISTGIKNQPIPATGPVPRLRRLQPLIPGDPAVRVKVEEFEVHNDGVFTGITLRPEFKPPMLIGLTSIPRNFVNSRLKYEVRIPFELLPDDPTLRIRWTVIDLDAASIVVNDDNVALGRLEFELVPGAIGPNVSRIGIECRVYRTLGAEITDFFNDGIRLDIRPQLATPPYVRWRYDVKNPQVYFDEKAESWRLAPEFVTRRHSVIHRTDQPCTMAADRSRYTYSTELLQQLPFSLDQIVKRRDQLCDYCFFGGPARSLPSL